MRVLITGAGGLLGSEVQLAFVPYANIVAANHQQLDVCSRKSIISAIQNVKPDWIVNCAAATQVDRCESDHEWADKLNFKAPLMLAEECSIHNVRLLHVSTDYVFDGNTESSYVETDLTCPINYYGETKLCGEVPVLEYGGCVVRTQWLYGRIKPGLIGRVIKQKSTKVISDCTGCPTWAKDAAQVIFSIVKNDCIGLFHAANEGSATWMDFAQEIVHLWDCGTILEPIHESELILPAKRPRFSVLNCKKLSEVGIKPPRDWQDALHEFYWREGMRI